MERLLGAQPWIRGVPSVDHKLVAAHAHGLRYNDTVPGTLSAQLRADVCPSHETWRPGSVRVLHEQLLATLAADAPGATPCVRMHRPLAYLPELVRSAGTACVFLVRDARDVVLSRIRRGERGASRMVVEWRAFARLARSLAGRHSVLCVRFEELVGDPAQVLARVSRFVGGPIEYPPPDDAMQWPEHSSFGHLPRAVSPHVALRWRHRRQEPLARFAGWACRSELGCWGYERWPRDVSATERFRFAVGLRVARYRSGLRTVAPRAVRWIGGSRRRSERLPGVAQQS